MAISADGAVLLADLRVEGFVGRVPVVLEDVSLRWELAAELSSEGRVVCGGGWVATLRRLCRATLRRRGLSGVVDGAELVVSELVSNALRHGTGREITFRFLLSTDLLVIVVDDRSPGRPVVGRAGPESEAGRGMFLVQAVADAWGVSADESRTWCALTTHGREEVPE